MQPDPPQASLQSRGPGNTARKHILSACPCHCRKASAWFQKPHGNCLIPIPDQQKPSARWGQHLKPFPFPGKGGRHWKGRQDGFSGGRSDGLLSPCHPGHP